MRMSGIFWTVVLGVLFFLSCSQNTEDPIQDVQFDVDKQIGDWVDMWDSYDLSLVENLFLTDSRVTYFSSEYEGVIKGIEAIRKHHEGFGFVPGGKEQENKLWVEDIHSEVFGTTAVVTGIWYFSQGSEKNEKPQRGPMTLVYIREGDEFRLAHLNFGEYLKDKEQ